MLKTRLQLCLQTDFFYSMSYLLKTFIFSWEIPPPHIILCCLLSHNYWTKETLKQVQDCLVSRWNSFTLLGVSIKKVSRQIGFSIYLVAQTLFDLSHRSCQQSNLKFYLSRISCRQLKFNWIVTKETICISHRINESSFEQVG